MVMMRGHFAAGSLAPAASLGALLHNCIVRKRFTCFRAAPTRLSAYAAMGRVERR